MSYYLNIVLLIVVYVKMSCFFLLIMFVLNVSCQNVVLSFKKSFVNYCLD